MEYEIARNRLEYARNKKQKEKIKDKETKSNDTYRQDKGIK